MNIELNLKFFNLYLNFIYFNLNFGQKYDQQQNKEQQNKEAPQEAAQPPPCTQTSTTDAVMEGTLPSQSSAVARPRKKKSKTNMNAPSSTTQGGIFNVPTQASVPTNTALGIRAQSMTKKGSQVTSTTNLLSARNERIAALHKKPVWKL